RLAEVGDDSCRVLPARQPCARRITGEVVCSYSDGVVRARAGGLPHVAQKGSAGAMGRSAGLRERLVLESELGDEAREDDIGRQVLLRDPPRGEGVSAIVGLDRLDRRRRLVERRERVQAFAAREMLAEAGVLHDDRPAAREVARAPVAEPSAPRRDEDLLADGELAARSGDVVAPRIEGRRRRMRVAESPARALELRARNVLAGDRELERRSNTPRQVEELRQLEIL